VGNTQAPLQTATPSKLCAALGLPRGLRMDGTLLDISRDCLFPRHVTALALPVICSREAFDFHATNKVDRGV
jgi:hypothetical protein